MVFFFHPKELLISDECLVDVCVSVKLRLLWLNWPSSPLKVSLKVLKVAGYAPEPVNLLNNM